MTAAGVWGFEFRGWKCTLGSWSGSWTAHPVGKTAPVLCAKTQAGILDEVEARTPSATPPDGEIWT